MAVIIYTVVILLSYHVNIKNKIQIGSVGHLAACVANTMCSFSMPGPQHMLNRQCVALALSGLHQPPVLLILESWAARV